MSLATNYQKWVYETVLPYLGDSILEIGAGVGNMSQWLPQRKKLYVTEAVTEFIPILKSKLPESPQLEVHNINVDQSWHHEFFNKDIDTIVSFNVLEHIKDDAKALQQFYEILMSSSTGKPKRIVTFVPAHSWAYGTVDKSFLHYRRYCRADFTRLREQLFPQAKMTSSYFNLLGLPGWIWHGKIRKNPSFGAGAVKYFEKISPFVRPIDDFLHQKLDLPIGQSIWCVYEF